MTAAVVQSVQAGHRLSSYVTLSVGLDSPVTNNVLYVVVAFQDLSGTITCSVSDNLGNSYNSAGVLTLGAGGTYTHYAFWTEVSNPDYLNAVVTASFSASATAAHLTVHEISGIGALDSYGIGDDTGNNPTTPVSATVSSAPAYGIAQAEDPTGLLMNPSAGWDDLGNFVQPGGGKGKAEGRRFITTGSKNADFDNPANHACTISFATFPEEATGPTILAHPEGQRKMSGDVAAFSVSATGTGSLTYQWQDDSSGSWANISGANSSWYAVEASLATNGRRYRVWLQDSVDEVYSKPATLTMLPAIDVPRRVPRRVASTHDWAAAGWWSPSITAATLWDADVVVQPASSGSSAPAGLAVETDSALPRGAARPAGLSAESDSALALVAVQARAAGLASEADAAQAVAPLQIRAAGQASESDASLALSGVAIRSAGLAVEADAAIAPAGLQRRAAGLSSEADASLALGAVQIGAVSLASEADSAFALSAKLVRATGLSGETDSALALTPSLGSAVGAAVESDSSLPLTGVQLRQAGVSSEADSALSLGALLIRAAGAASEADTALALARLQIGPVGLASEAGSALALAPVVARPVGLATESDIAFGLAALQRGAAGLADEADVALALAALQLREVGAADEADSAFGLTALQLRQTGLSIENDTAFALAISGFVGLSAQHAAWLEALARVHGLIDPLQVTGASRTDGTVAQSIAESLGTTTVTPISVPSGSPGASALTPTQAGWLEALVRAHGLIDALHVSAAQRTDGVLVQSIAEAGGVVTLERTA